MIISDPDPTIQIISDPDLDPTGQVLRIRILKGKKFRILANPNPELWIARHFESTLQENVSGDN